jgi:hypothetical protein
MRLRLCAEVRLCSVPIEAKTNKVFVLRLVYNCAFEREVLWQGKMYITANYVSFYGMIFGKTSIITLPLREVVCIEKKNTVGMFPNAIRISTLDTKYVFSSFLKRDSAYADLMDVWKACNLYLVRDNGRHIHIFGV